MRDRFLPARFPPGPVPTILRQARWIWPEDLCGDLVNGYALFRKGFILPRVPPKAPLFITADQSYQLYVNGRLVCRGPARGFQSHWPYDEVDLNPWLRKGRNLIAVRAYNPGFSNFQYLSQGWAGLLVAAVWGQTRLLTDASWKCRRQDGIVRNTVTASLQLFPQEHVDARREPQGWWTTTFDDRAWEQPKRTPPWNCMPWSGLEPRMIPLLNEKTIAPRTLIGAGQGRCATDYRHTRDVAYTRHQEDMTHQPCRGSPRRLAVPPTGPNAFRSYLLDFGRTVVGNLVLRVTGTRGGEIVDTLHVETIDPRERRPHLAIPTGCRMAFGSRLICRAGHTEHRFYHPFGFRYLMLTVRDSAVALKVDAQLNWIGYPLERRGRFMSSDTALADIWECCAWTQQCCSLDAYVDTPWREQAQWWGDARIQAWNTFHLSGDARLFRRGIHCIASQTTPDGLTYGHAPTMAHNCILPDFTLIWMLTLWDYYWQTGSLEPFLTHQSVLEAALGYFRRQTDPRNGLVAYDERYWLFLDWTDLFREGYPSVLNLWWLLTLEKMAHLYRLSRAPAKAKSLLEASARLRVALGHLVGKDGLVRDGLTFDNQLVRGVAIHAQTLAIMTGLHPSGESAMLKQVLRPYIRGEDHPKVQPSAYWISYVYEVLRRRGNAAEVIAHIRRFWTPMAAHGTTWEVFDPKPGEHSHSHAWSAHPLFHLMQIIGGITQTAPAWRRILFQPHFIGDHGGADIPTPLGSIASRWQRRDGTIRVNLSLPRGMIAEAHLPSGQYRRVTGRQAWLIRENG